ncbi:hypothetical protein [Thermofilum sp.]|uniref:hypothetical protein n=1 Tax=Thermofilum sp. TaxID=1961369 RepID=UPI00316785BB
MRVKVLTPPDETLLSSMLYEGYLRIVSECGEEATEECVSKAVQQLLEEKEVYFGFAGNDLKYTLNKISKEFNVDQSEFSGLKFLLKLKVQDLAVAVRLVKLSSGKDAVLVGTSGFDGTAGYTFQIMKVDRYKGISSPESKVFWKDVTTYADLSGVFLFFTGLASSYVTRVREVEEGESYYFLFFDTETLLNRVIGGNLRNWIAVKDELLKRIKERIERYGGINDEAITLTVLFNTYLLEELERSQVRYVGFRLVRVNREGQTYKVYVDMPLRVYHGRRIYESIGEDREAVERINRIVDTLVEPAARFVRGRDDVGDGYHAFKALRYLFMYITTENPLYVGMMHRELHEAYRARKSRGKPGAERYLACFLKPTIGY